MANFKVVKRFVILVLILIVPGFLYYLLQAKGKNRYKPLPVYGPKQVAKTFHKVRGQVIYDTIYHQIPDFKLYDQENKLITQKNFEGKILLVNFFFTQCPTLCKEINKNVADLATAYKKNNILKFVSITVDPATDNASVLKKYATSLKADENQWKFLTGDTSTIYPLSRNGFLVTAVNGNNNPENFVYSEKLILVDQDRRIRGYYNGTSVNEMTKLNDEIKVLIAEELRKIKSNLY
ncbi:SCO family protein [Mucilaginibacter arboris]|uniref:Redoxin family protein n=1 Tax=Mucilaginibacter arboris TaxID=2682090 RepID=A0A7K1SUZ0_9SPHI|nr:SCO family protein [Mucilaginibacter arboris]MVN21141.1 redoxin family protein [Mucilaginibacter arboris]